MPSWHPPNSDSVSIQYDESIIKVHNDAKTRFSWIWPFGIWTNTADDKVSLQRKTRRKTKGKNDDNWRYCTKNCIHGGKNPNKLVQCHLCQGWIHPECVGEDDKDIVGIWTCTTCRVIPTHVHDLLDRMVALEALIVKLDKSNEQLVSLVSEQNNVIHALRDDRRVARRPGLPDIDNARSPSVTLLAGNSLLRDVHDGAFTSGKRNAITVRKKSGATLNDIVEMIDEVSRADNLDIGKIVIVGGTRELMGNVPTHEIKENMELLVQKAKTVTPSVTVSSVLPCSKGANPEQLAEVSDAIKLVCDNMDVIFVDHESNLTFRNGNVDTSAFLGDGLHLSASGVDRVLSNMSLPKQTSRKTVKRQRHESTRQSAIRVDEAARGSTARISRDSRPVNERHQHQQRQRHVRRSTDRDDTPQPTLDDTQLSGLLAEKLFFSFNL